MEQTATDAPPERKASRLRLGLLVVAAVVVAASAGFLALSSLSVEGEVSRLAAALDRDDPGWRIRDVERGRAVVPDDENGALAVKAFRRTLGNRPFVTEEIDRIMSTPPGVRIPPDEIRKLREALGREAAALAAARLLADLPRGRHTIDLRDDAPWETLLPDAQEARHAASVLRLDALRQALDGRPDAALVSVRACLHAGATMGDEPFAISMMIRWACRSVAVAGLEHTLSLGEPSAAEMKKLEAAIRAEEADGGYRRVVRGERAVIFAAVRAMGRGRAMVSQFAEIHPWLAWEERHIGIVVKRMAAADLPKLLGLFNDWHAATAKPDHEQIAAEEALSKRRTMLSTGNAILGGTFRDPRRVGTAHRRTLSQLRCGRVALAAERYRRDHAAWPADLAALVPAYLDAVPLDPFDGKPLRYKRYPDGVGIYSIGDDLKDDGGDTVRGKPGTPQPKDFGVRLWDADVRARLRAEEIGPPKEGP